jgi:hypothetical protein
VKENSIEEDIIKKFEKFCENLYVFKDDDMGGHFEKIVGNQRANTTLGYLVFKENLEEKLSDYKRVLKENEELKIKNNAIKRESEAYVEHMIRLDNELNLEKEKSKYEWIRQNCLSQELVNKLYIPIQKIKDKMSERQFELQQEYKNFEDDSILIVLQELLEGRK